MTNRDDGHATKSSSVKTLFAMVITRILFGYGGAVEDLLGQGKIQAVLFKIAFAFGFCPCVVHSLHYIYERMYLIALIRCKKGDRSLPFLFGWGRCAHRNPTIFEVVGLRDEAANPTYVLLVGLNPTYHEASNMNVVRLVTEPTALREEPL